MERDDALALTSTGSTRGVRRPSPCGWPSAIYLDSDTLRRPLGPLQPERLELAQLPRGLRSRYPDAPVRASILAKASKPHLAVFQAATRLGLRLHLQPSALAA